MLLHLEAQAKHRLGKGAAPKRPEWIIEEQQGRGVQGDEDGLLGNAHMGGMVRTHFPFHHSAPDR